MAQSQKDIKKKLSTSQYRHPDSASRDIHALIQNFKNLKIQDPAQFAHPNGANESLCALKGTIPVKIKGSTYNIPMAIWLRKDHPHQSPIVFVTPTATMGIQPSRFMDRNGMVYLPYLSEWKANHSDLTALTQVMCATFGENCPVFSRRGSAPAQPPPQPQWPPRPPPNQHNPAGYGGVPYPPPPRPPTSSYSQGPYQAPYPPSSTSMPSPYGSYQPPAATGAPVYPPQQHGQYPSSSPVYAGGHPSQPMPSPHIPQSSATTTTATALGSAAVAAMSAEEERRKIEESEQIKRKSLETAVEDRIRRHVRQAIDAAESEMEILLKTQDELKKGSLKINSMLQEMESKQSEVDQSVEMLKTKNTELQSVLDYLSSQPDVVQVDETVDATTPLYKQILQLYAEENAIDDTVYYLGEALRKGVIELEVYLKHVRELSRQQFMARATIMKARLTAGLPTYGEPV